MVDTYVIDRLQLDEQSFGFTQVTSTEHATLG
jgi:hypothetical protein